MNNCRFLWNNTGLDKARIKATSEKSTLPAANIQDTIRGKVWRTDGTGVARLDIDLGSAAYANALGLISHTMNVDASFTVTAWDDGELDALDAAAATDEGGGLVGLPATGHHAQAGDQVFVTGTTNYDGLQDVDSVSANVVIIDAGTFTAETFSGAEIITTVTASFSREFAAYDPIRVFGEGIFGEGLFGGFLSEEDLDFMPRLSRAVYWDDVEDSTIWKRFWSIEFDNGVDELDLGRVFLCNYFEPEYNFTYGWSLTIKDPSKVTRSVGGVKHTDEQEQYYVASFSFDDLHEGEAFGQFLKIIKYVGVRQDILLCMFPSNELLNAYTAIYGRFASSPSITNNRYQNHQTRVQFEESV